MSLDIVDDGALEPGQLDVVASVVDSVLHAENSMELDSTVARLNIVQDRFVSQVGGHESAESAHAGFGSLLI